MEASGLLTPALQASRARGVPAGQEPADFPGASAAALAGERTRRGAAAGAAVALAAGALLVTAALAAFSRNDGRQPESFLTSSVISAAAAADPAATVPPCLCVFDIDRTLTGKQGWAQQCPADKQMDGVDDQAYAQGTLLLSSLALGLNETFCNKCFTGIVTAGIASGEGSKERELILESLGGTEHTRSDVWQNIRFRPHTTVNSSLVVLALDGSKQESVRSMVSWWGSAQRVHLEPEDVYFFDDIATNVQAFAGTGLNARQVSCASRGPKEQIPGSFDGKIGGCGGVPEEVVDAKGVHVCP